jgi:hypothetical protein
MDQHAFDMNHMPREFVYLARGFLTSDHPHAALSAAGRIAS